MEKAKRTTMAVAPDRDRDITVTIVLRIPRSYEMAFQRQWRDDCIDILTQHADIESATMQIPPIAEAAVVELETW